MYAILFQFAIQLKTVLHYQLNKEALTQKYCVNKNKPEVSCFARCYLNKELKAQKPVPEGEEEAAPVSESSSFKFSILYFVRYSLAPWVMPASENRLQNATRYLNLVQQTWGNSPFHPPIFQKR